MQKLKNTRFLENGYFYKLLITALFGQKIIKNRPNYSEKSIFSAKLIKKSQFSYKITKFISDFW